GAEHRVPALGPGSRVTFVPLRTRRDGDEWLVGCPERGLAVAMPPVGVRAVELLDTGRTVAEASAELTAEVGEEHDVGGFARELAETGLVAAVDGARVPPPETRRATFPWLRPGHVRFMLSPWLPVVAAAVVAAAVAVLAAHPAYAPSYRRLLWTPDGALVLGTSVAAGWLLALVHECAHMLAARAIGVPSRISLGTRLQFLVVQTDMSGIEVAPRRHRLTAYLAGVGTNLVVAAGATLLLPVTDPAGVAHRIAAAVAVLALMPLAFECMVFMRTDGFFVLEDLTGCRDLHHDGAAYVQYLLRSAFAWVRPGGSVRPGDPTVRLRGRERKAVRAYAVVLTLGTLACLAVLVTVALPVDVTLLTQSAQRIIAARSPGDVANAAVVIVALVGVQVLWCVTWWRRRKARQRAGQSFG
ncbi:MAG TPA: hypothetical protein VF053_07635, partial [Streptosporangiales bacterium]